MQIPGVSSSDNPYGAVDPYATQELDKNAFMQLLVTQLENQDPLQPANNEEFIAQLASFSSLEQLEQLNDNIIAMIALNHGNALLSQLTQGSSLIGKEVAWEDPDTGLEQVGIVDSVKIQDGIAYLNIDGQEVPLGAVTEITGDGQTTDSESGDGSEDGGEGDEGGAA